MGRMEESHAKKFIPSSIPALIIVLAFGATTPARPPTMIFSSTELSPGGLQVPDPSTRNSPPATFLWHRQPRLGFSDSMLEWKRRPSKFHRTPVFGRGRCRIPIRRPSGDPAAPCAEGTSLHLDIGASYTAVPSLTSRSSAARSNGGAGGRHVMPAVALRTVAPSCSADQKCTWKPIAPISRSARVFSSSSPTPVSDNCSQQPTDSAAIRLANGGVDFRKLRTDERFRRPKIAPPVIPFSLVAEADFSTVTAYSIRANFSF